MIIDNERKAFRDYSDSEEQFGGVCSGKDCLGDVAVPGMSRLGEYQLWTVVFGVDDNIGFIETRFS
jgi:hypothetical protein